MCSAARSPRPTSTDFKDDLRKLDIVGIYPNYKEALKAWRGKAQATVDNAQMRYFVVHIHRLMEPDEDESKRDADPPSPALEPRVLNPRGNEHRSADSASQGHARPVPERHMQSHSSLRLVHDYMREQWRTLAIAVTCMVITAAMTAALAWLTDPAIKLPVPGQARRQCCSPHPAQRSWP